MANYLQWPDYVILVLFLAISLGIGVYHSLTGGRQRTTQEFIMANRHLKILPTAMSLLVSFQSALVILGSTAEMYAYGAQYMLMAPIALSLGIFLAERLMVPWIYRMKLVSINEYLELRYRSKTIRILGSVLGILVAITYMGVAMFAPSVALHAAVGFPLTLSIPLMSVVCIAYTALGGMRAVIWTDVFQFIMMMAGIIAIMIRGLILVGGIGEVFRTCGVEGRLQLINWSFDPTVRHTFWGLLLGSTTACLFIYGTTQAAVQRYSAVTTLKQARIMMLLNVPITIVMYVFLCTVGLTVTAYYAHKRCDPIVNKEIYSPNQLLTHFVSTVFAETRGFAGLFMATLYGAALSSVSSSLSGAAANCWEDVLKWKLDARLSEYNKALVNRGLVILFGFASTGFAFLSIQAPGTLLQISMAFGTLVGGPLSGLFLLGGLSRIPNWKGALIGTSVSLAVITWIGVGSLFSRRPHATLLPVSVDGCASVSNWTSDVDYPAYNFTRVDDSRLLNIVTNHTDNQQPDVAGFNQIYAISYVWYMPLGSLLTIVFGLVASLLFKDDILDFDARLLISFREMFSRWKEDELPIDVNEMMEVAEKQPTANEMLPLRFKSDETSACDEKGKEQGMNCNLVAS